MRKNKVSMLSKKKIYLEEYMHVYYSKTKKGFSFFKVKFSALKAYFGQFKFYLLFLNWYSECINITLKMILISDN